MYNLDKCIYCGSSFRLEQSEFENNEPVFISDKEAICGNCYKNISNEEYKNLFKNK